MTGSDTPQPRPGPAVELVRATPEPPPVEAVVLRLPAGHAYSLMGALAEYLDGPGKTMRRDRMGEIYQALAASL